jgi:hypothetical protein
MLVLGDRGLLRGLARNNLVGVRLLLDRNERDDSETSQYHHPSITNASERRTSMSNGRFKHLYRRLGLREWGRTGLHPVFVGLGRDFELRDEHPSFKALVLEHVLLEQARQSIAVCVERIIAILKSGELRTDGN